MFVGAVVAVMSTLPASNPVTSPALTVATVLLLLLQVAPLVQLS